MASQSKPFVGRVYRARKDGKQDYEWVGRYATEKERDKAVMRRRIELEKEDATHSPGERITWNEYVDRYLENAARELKASSYGTARASLKAFREEFGERPLAS